MLKDIEEVNQDYFYSTRGERVTQIKLDSTLTINLCLRCKEAYTSDRLDLLERIITYNFLNIPIEDKETYFNFLNFRGTKEEFITSLGELKGENPSK